MRFGSRDALIKSGLLCFASVLCTSLVWTASSPVFAQTFPSKPIRIQVGFTAGSSVDILGRMIAQKLSEAWQQPVIVENRPGAAGNVAADVVAKSPGDGYMLLLSNNGLAISAALYRKLPFNALEDLAPVVHVASAPHVLVIAPALPLIRAGRLRALCVSGASRSAVLPDVPTFAEAGLPGYQVKEQTMSRGRS